ncbi:MAG: DUF6785 family protein [Lentisphaeria bacterium]|nr:DUF6785 family protein [Lentisphaeria bacterium]
MKTFTVKSVLFALLGMCLVCAFPPFARSVLGAHGAISGYLPVIPVFFVVLLSFFWNMTVGRGCRRLALSTRELALVVCLMLVVAWIPAMQSSLVRHLVLPRYEETTTNASWKDAELTERLPAALFPAGESGESIGERVHFGFIQGGLPVAETPYGAWLGPLLHWLPLLVLLTLVLIALTFLVHRQWSVHEQLPYPLASVVNALIRQDDQRPGGTLYRNRLFWYGCLFVFGYHLLRYLNAWFPSQIPKITPEYVLEWFKLFPIMGADRSNAVFFVVHWMPISFAIIGIAYFVPADVSLSMGLTAPLGTLLGIQYYVATGNPVSSTGLEVIRSGGFIAFGIILVYTGRAYYFPVLAKALMPWRRTSKDPTAVWAARVFLVGYVLLIAVVAAMGVDLLVAWVVVTFALLIFLVVTRLVCETGLPSFAPSWSLQALLPGLFGTGAIGAAPLVFITLLGRTIVAAESTNLFMPYMATSLKVLDDNQVSPRRFAVAAKVAIGLALVAGFVAVLAISYANGEGNLSKGERGELGKTVHEILNLKDTGQLAAAEAAHGFGKLSLLRPDGSMVRLVLVGMGAVLATYLLRFRFAKWPLHPLFFVVLGSNAGRFTWFCFLLGWGIKCLVVKFGGGRGYRTLKPLFIGLIVGESLILGLTFVVGTIYYLRTGNQPVGIGMF